MSDITGTHVLLKDKNGNYLFPETIKTSVISVDNLYVPTSDAVSKAITSAIDTHKHSISDINNLQTTLDGKASSNHTHSYVGFPDYAKGSDITSDFKSSSSHGGANRYKASANGWIVCTPQSKVYVNGATFYTAHNGDAGLTNDSIFPVKSGDIVTGGASSMYFFPMR